ncbi:uncharacterized protein CIMG_07721 [Coccidioides immitis RS]|uniref:Uncharacterized protein n=1 Tax=Coccidioides immitis (strain RS) TaxID=246410 RepID=J3K3Z2_COCIM|nr:uncharacterized protein CIMG_07721 [Coccidioides immitis RS]EAS28975.3 hypothetical protein CIMG_07721 [Coccidioides immitis RS]
MEIHSESLLPNYCRLLAIRREIHCMPTEELHPEVRMRTVIHASLESGFWNREIQTCRATTLGLGLIPRRKAVA